MCNNRFASKFMDVIRFLKQCLVAPQNVNDSVCFRNTMVLDQRSDVRLLAHLGLRQQLWLQTPEEVCGGLAGLCKILKCGSLPPPGPHFEEVISHK
jgi:hypothetical protein